MNNLESIKKYIKDSVNEKEIKDNNVNNIYHKIKFIKENINLNDFDYVYINDFFGKISVKDILESYDFQNVFNDNEYYIVKVNEYIESLGIFNEKTHSIESKKLNEALKEFIYNYLIEKNCRKFDIYFSLNENVDFVKNIKIDNLNEKQVKYINKIIGDKDIKYSLNYLKNSIEKEVKHIIDSNIYSNKSSIIKNRHIIEITNYVNNIKMNGA